MFKVWQSDRKATEATKEAFSTLADAMGAEDPEGLRPAYFVLVAISKKTHADGRVMGGGRLVTIAPRGTSEEDAEAGRTVALDVAEVCIHAARDQAETDAGGRGGGSGNGERPS